MKTQIHTEREGVVDGSNRYYKVGYIVQRQQIFRMFTYNNFSLVEIHQQSKFEVFLLQEKVIM